jgi:hypothetical protein
MSLRKTVSYVVTLGRLRNETRVVSKRCQLSKMDMDRWGINKQQIYPEEVHGSAKFPKRESRPAA